MKATYECSIKEFASVLREKIPASADLAEMILKQAKKTLKDEDDHQGILKIAEDCGGTTWNSGGGCVLASFFISRRIRIVLGVKGMGVSELAKDVSGNTPQECLGKMESLDCDEIAEACVDFWFNE